VACRIHMRHVSYATCFMMCVSHSFMICDMPDSCVIHSIMIHICHTSVNTDAVMTGKESERTQRLQSSRTGPTVTDRDHPISLANGDFRPGKSFNLQSRIYGPQAGAHLQIWTHFFTVYCVWSHDGVIELLNFQFWGLDLVSESLKRGKRETKRGTVTIIRWPTLRSG